MRLLILALVGLTCLQSPLAAAQEAPRYHLIDLSGDFVRFYDATQGQSDTDRVAAFYRDVAPRFPEFYSPARFDAGRQDQRILTAIRQFPALRERYLSASAQFTAALDPAFASFSRSFPDMRPIGDVYLLNSMGEMDGGTRTFHGQTYFVFGADVMARVHGRMSSERPFFHHELFHIYHQRFFHSCEAVWCGLWQEGLATYVAAQLNPGSTDDDLLLTFPHPIRPKVDRDLAHAVCFAYARLSSSKQEDYAQLFQGQTHPPGLPARFGYYVGYRVAQELGRTHSLQDLAHLSDDEVRPLLDATLRGIAPSCPLPPN